MSDRLRVGVIGAGRPRAEAGATGFGMAHAHVRGYLATGCCDLVAVADLNPENAADFVARYPGEARTYTDYGEMLAAERPDVVSICTWPHLHAPMVLDAVGAGVRAIHCEKPMAPTWGEARQMHRAASSKGVQLTFNHQRRFLAPFQEARRLIRAGALGEVRRLEGACPNLMDWGTHWLDMFCFLNEETPPVWVLGQIDASRENVVYALPHEHQALCQVMFANGARGLLFTGPENDIGCQIRVVGSEGTLELDNTAPHLRRRLRGDPDWVGVDTAGEGLHGDLAVERGVADLIRCLETGDEPELSSRKAVRSTEIIFATYESSRRRARVDLPLEAEDSALLAMLAAGDLAPQPAA